MNTNDLKYFGQEARKLLMGGVSRKLAFWGFNNEGIALEEPNALHGGYVFRGMVYDDPTVPIKWNKLQEAVKQNGFNEVVEKAAYVWFNRLIALQILGKNEYDLPQLEPASADEATPLILKRARQGQYGFLNPEEQSRLQKILTDYGNETQAFAILLIGYCHQHTLINSVFGGIDDYTELLLPDDILAPGGFLDFLNNGEHITDEDYTKVELIGWLYQFYITEKKAEVFKKFKANKKAEKEDIPAATQIFTPNWIVKYMVENTVGRIWLDLYPNSPIRDAMKYMVEPSEQTGEKSNSIISEVKELKLLDPAVGSGHILVEGFELLYDMYMEELYPADEAVESILQNNLFGLDIDVRAAQLAQFAVLMKAAQKYPGILQRNIIPHIYAMPEPVAFTKEDIQLFLGEEGKQYLKPLQDALHLMLQAQNLGAIMQFQITEEARAFVVEQLNQWQQRTNLDLFEQELLYKLIPYLKIIKVLTLQYEAIAANPPYMQSKNFNAPLKKYVESFYVDGKADLFAVFLDASINLICSNGFIAEVTMQSWMFLSSFKKLRHRLVYNKSIIGLIDVGWNLFDNHSFPAAVVCFNKNVSYKTEGVYHDLTNVKVDREKLNEFWDLKNKYVVNQSDFRLIPDCPIAYWLTHNERALFSLQKIKNYGSGKKGLSTGNNDLFLRNWTEVSFKKTSLSSNNLDGYWKPLNKGGNFRKWYGNNETLIFWKDKGKKLKEFPGSVLRNEEYFFKPCITSGLVSYVDFSARMSDPGYIFEAGGTGLFVKNDIYILGFLSTIIANRLLRALNPTINYNISDIENLPLIIANKEVVENIVVQNISISKSDWNSRETAWDFKSSPLLNDRYSIKEACGYLTKNLSQNYFQLHTNEESLNKLFIEIYNLGSELSPEVPLKSITILQEELDFQALNFIQRPIQPNEPAPIKKDVILQQFISYAVGCFMGRYRLDKAGLQIAHPNPTLEETVSYSYTSPATNQAYLFNIDEDAILPLIGKKSIFTDDAIKRFQEFVQIIWGDETLTQNLNFVQECLNREIEDYLVSHFWKYHVKMYSKKPIYWLFTSKSNAFQVLVYMHRMNRFTVEKIRDKYLLKHIQHLQQQIQSLETKGGALTRDEQKKLDQLRTDELECSDYELVLKDVATQQIEFDLDDGVTKNYALFQKVVAPIK